MNCIKNLPDLRDRSEFLSAVLAAVFLHAILTPVFHFVTAQTLSSATIRGLVTAETTGAPIPNAQITIPLLGLHTTTNSAGEFSWEAISLDDAVVPVTVHVTAENFGDWTLQDVRVLRDETLIIKAKLEQSPVTIIIPPPSNERTLPPDSIAAMVAAESSGPSGAPGDFIFPHTIRVRVTGNPYCNTTIPYTVEIVNFKDYVKHVLPNEWWASWPGESLRAGAMAAKMYAWYWIAAGGKWDDADVYDSTCDQVYNPAVEYESTNLAVDFTWNWLMMRDSQFILTQYRAYDYQCGSADCMGQWDSRDKALNNWTWDEILLFYYDPASLEPVWNPPGGYSLRFNGIYNDEENRVMIPIDDPTDNNPGPPVDIGTQDFTLEWWMKALPGENGADAITCGENKDWLAGNMIFDRNRFGEDRGFGASMAGEMLVFGVSGDGSGDRTICGTSNLADGTWHHLALQRSSADGWLQLFVDGVLEAEGDGPDGDVSYPDDYIPPDLCGISGDQPCVNSDPYLVIGAEKHRSSYEHPSFSGWIDEIRFSNVLRYSADFTVPGSRFSVDENTVALYQLNEGFGNPIHDTSGFGGDPSDGERIYGGVINGPEWTWDTPWYLPPPTPIFTPASADLHTILIPSAIEAGSSRTQWVVKVTPNMQTPTGTALRFMVWLHIPDTWQLAWGRQFSMNGEFHSIILTKNNSSLTWISTPGSCSEVSVPPAPGYKWRAWQGPLEHLPSSHVRLASEVILRGNFSLPPDINVGLYPDIRWVLGTYYDTDNDGSADTYACSSMAATAISVWE